MTEPTRPTRTHPDPWANLERRIDDPISSVSSLAPEIKADIRRRIVRERAGVERKLLGALRYSRAGLSASLLSTTVGADITYVTYVLESLAAKSRLTFYDDTRYGDKVRLYRLP